MSKTFYLNCPWCDYRIEGDYSVAGPPPAVTRDWHNRYARHIDSRHVARRALKAER